jgi:hypothetical protein
MKNCLNASLFALTFFIYSPSIAFSKCAQNPDSGTEVIVEVEQSVQMQCPCFNKDMSKSKIIIPVCKIIGRAAPEKRFFWPSQLEIKLRIPFAPKYTVHGSKDSKICSAKVGEKIRAVIHPACRDAYYLPKDKYFCTDGELPFVCEESHNVQTYLTPISN